MTPTDIEESAILNTGLKNRNSCPPQNGTQEGQGSLDDGKYNITTTFPCRKFPYPPSGGVKVHWEILSLNSRPSKPESMMFPWRLQNQ